MDLIRCRQWGLAAELPAKAALKKDLADVVIRYFKVAAPVVDALNTPIARDARAEKKSAFRAECSAGLTRLPPFAQVTRERVGRPTFWCAKPAPNAGFRGPEGPKSGKNRCFTYKNPRKLWKSRIFPLTLYLLRPHGNHRQGSS